MSVLSAIHENVAVQLRNRVALNDISFHAYPDASAPANKIEVWPGSGTYVGYWGTFGSNGTADVMFRIRVEVAHGDASTGGRKMVELLGVGSTEHASIVDAIVADPTLGGAVETTRVIDCEWDVDPDTWNHVGWINCEAVLRKSGAQA